MAIFTFANNIQTSLAVPASSTATTITLSSSANLPATIPTGQYLAITLNDIATGQFFEIVYATRNLGGGQLQVIRGQEGTTARAWNTNDKAYSCATAGVLASFLNSGALGNFVQLSPAVRQTGNILVSGNINTNGAGQFGAGVVVGGALTSATTGGFSGDVTALDFIATRAYTNTSLANMPLRVNGAGGVIGIGPSSGLAAHGVTASALAIGLAGSANFVAIDNTGNIGATGNMLATNITAGNAVQGAQGIFGPVTAGNITQNSNRVVDTITSPGRTISVTKSGGTYELDINGSSNLAIGASFSNDGNGGNPYIPLPAYGQWFVEVFYGLIQTSNSNLTISLYLSSGSMTSFISNANGVTAYNSNAWITLYGKGSTTVNNQTLRFTLNVSGGSLDPSNQPWTVRATRTG